MSSYLKVMVLLAVVAATIVDGQTYETPRREPNFGIYAAEAGGAVAGALVGACFGVAIGIGSGGNNTNRMLAIGGLFGIPAVLAGWAGGTCVAGNAFQQHGRFLPTLGWTAGTATLGVVLLDAGTWVDVTSRIGPGGGAAVSDLGLAVLAAMPIITVYGYNLSRPRDSYGSRFVPGSVGLASVRQIDGTKRPSVNIRFLSVRF
ncbi:MAG: hypothetical protein NTX53_04890 [candidate division WOR-3 bacterium]|nr:hypothetical protein [candidate division WOR-3 bacterium]